MPQVVASIRFFNLFHKSWLELQLAIVYLFPAFHFSSKYPHKPEICKKPKNSQHFFKKCMFSTPLFHCLFVFSGIVPWILLKALVLSKCSTDRVVPICSCMSVPSTLSKCSTQPGCQLYCYNSQLYSLEIPSQCHKLWLALGFLFFSTKAGWSYIASCYNHLFPAFHFSSKIFSSQSEIRKKPKNSHHFFKNVCPQPPCSTVCLFFLEQSHSKQYSWLASLIVDA